MAITESTHRQGSVVPFPARRLQRPRRADFKGPWTEWRRRRRYREDLDRLLRTGPHLIADIGLTVEAARREIAKPFWHA